jgi:hypothetical protein
LFGAPRPPQIILEQLQIVIGLQHESVRRADPFDNQPRGMPQISQEPNVTRGRANQEPDRILRIVRDGKGLDQEIPHFEGGAGLEHAAREGHALRGLNRFTRMPVAEQRDTQFTRDLRQTPNVVAVLVRHQDAVEGLRGATQQGQSLANLPATEPGVDQQPRLLGFQKRTVSVRPTAQDRKTNTHNPSLKTGTPPGNPLVFLGPGASLRPI